MTNEYDKPLLPKEEILSYYANDIRDMQSRFRVVSWALWTVGLVLPKKREGWGTEWWSLKAAIEKEGAILSKLKSGRHDLAQEVVDELVAQRDNAYGRYNTFGQPGFGEQAKETPSREALEKRQGYMLTSAAESDYYARSIAAAYNLRPIREAGS